MLIQRNIDDSLKSGQISKNPDKVLESREIGEPRRTGSANILNQEERR